MTTFQHFKTLMLTIVAYSLTGCSNTENTEAEVSSNNASLVGIWNCHMERETGESFLSMTGHTNYQPNGTYEATGLGILNFGEPFDQLRWVATSSGSFLLSESRLEISVSHVKATPLFELGFDDIGEAAKTELTTNLINSINENDNVDYEDISDVLLITETRLRTQDKEANIWNCEKILKVSN